MMKLKINKLLQDFDLYQLLFSKFPALYRRQDLIVHLSVAALFLWAIIIRIANSATNGFTTLDFATEFATAIPGLLILWIIAVFLREKHPRTGLFLASFSQSFLFVFVVAYALSGAITTPFPIIDHQLLALDEKLGFSSLGVLNWTYQFPWLVSWLHTCYDTWFFQIVLTPMLLALFNESEEINRYFVATFTSLLIGATIYYFWPTIAPAGILESAHFVSSQQELVTRFNQVHQHLPVTVFGGGMIAFPSFHVVNCLLVTYAWRQRLYIFIPLLVLNVSTIFSTVGLGYHYLVDVMGGFILAFLSIWLAYRLCRIFR